MIIISNDGKKYKVRKYIISSDGEESIWSDEWYGRHVIGQDCNWEALTGDRDCEELKKENDELRKRIAFLEKEVISMNNDIQDRDRDQPNNF